MFNNILGKPQNPMNGEAGMSDSGRVGKSSVGSINMEANVSTIRRLSSASRLHSLKFIKSSSFKRNCRT